MDTPKLNSPEAIRKVLIYTRVSTKDQEAENQIRQLREYAENRQWKIVDVIRDIASGGKTSKEREGLSRVLLLAHQRKFDALLFWSLDRLSREGVSATIGYLTTLEQQNIDWVSFSEPYLTTLGPFKDAIVAVLSSLARQERTRISERTKAGMARAKAEGKQFGRPRTSPERIAKAQELRATGLSYSKIGEHLGVGRVRAYQLCNE
jgi:putative DNA-invertase from lambdoid prophage Rac